MPTLAPPSLETNMLTGKETADIGRNGQAKKSIAIAKENLDKILEKNASRIYLVCTIGTPWHIECDDWHFMVTMTMCDKRKEQGKEQVAIGFHVKPIFNMNWVTDEDSPKPDIIQEDLDAIHKKHSPSE
jgi:hypothetical protein